MSMARKNDKRFPQTDPVERDIATELKEIDTLNNRSEGESGEEEEWDRKREEEERERDRGGGEFKVVSSWVP